MSVEKRFQGSARQAPPAFGETPWARHMPHRKVSAGSLAGALSVIIVWLANTYLLPQGNGITGEVASALTTVLTFLVAYMVPER